MAHEKGASRAWQRVQKLYAKLWLFFDQFTEAGRHWKRKCAAQKVVEAHGLRVLEWDDEIDLDLDRLAKTDMDLYLSVKTLRRAGYLVVNRDLRLIGSVRQAVFTESSEMQAEKRRATFRLVETSEGGAKTTKSQPLP